MLGFLWGEKMPLPTEAEMRDRTKTNAQMREMMAQIAGNVMGIQNVLTNENIHSLGHGHYVNNSVTQMHVDSLNYPLAAQCQIDVIKGVGSSVKHIYIRYNAVNRFFYKYFNGSAWTTIELISAEAVKTALEALATVKHRHAQTTHLNNLTAGKWFQTIVSAATTENGYPLADVCIINVEASEATSIKTQEIYYPALDRTFNRYFNGTTWTTTEDFTLKNNAVLKSYLAPSLLNEIPNKVEWLPVAAAWSMSYDPATKTLSWPHMLLAPKFSYSSTIRLRVPAGSIQLKTLTGYDYIWLDTTNIDQSTGNAQLSDIKFGTYSTSGYCEKNNQILIAKVDYAGNIHKAEGIPSITVLGQSTQATVKDTFRVVKTANQAYFYTPATNGNLVRYRFYRQIQAFDGVHAMSQSDFWRLAEVDAVDANSIAVVTKSLAENAEWDCAIRVTGAADHSGGVHGDELQDTTNFAPYFLLDGCKYAQDAVFDKQVKELTFVQESKIFFENTQNVLCTRQKIMKVTKAGIKNYQKIVFKAAANLFTAWLFLAPIRRKANNDNTGAQITDTFIRFPNYVPENVAEAGFTQVYTDTKDGDQFIISSAVSGVSVKVKLSNFNGMPKPVTHLSSANFYNKLYFSAIDSRVANYTTQVGETWEVTSEMSIDVAA